MFCILILFDIFADGLGLNNRDFVCVELKLISIYLFILQHPLTSIICSCAVSARIKARIAIYRESWSRVINT